MRSLLLRLADHMDIDGAVDERATEFMHDALPPALSRGTDAGGDELCQGRANPRHFDQKNQKQLPPTPINTSCG